MPNDNRYFVTQTGKIGTIHPNGANNLSSDLLADEVTEYPSLKAVCQKDSWHRKASEQGARYFVDQDGVIFAVFPDGSSNFEGLLEIRRFDSLVRSDEVWQLGEDEGNGERLVIDEHPLWPTLNALADAIEGQLIS